MRVELDDRDASAGWKFNEWEMKGVPVRLEVGPRDIENGVVTYVRRDTLEKATLPIDGLADALKALLEDVQSNMLTQARAFMDSHTTIAHNLDEVVAGANGGFALASWCGETECEEHLKADHAITTRNMPFDQSDLPTETCPICGKPAKYKIYFAKAY